MRDNPWFDKEIAPAEQANCGSAYGPGPDGNLYQPLPSSRRELNNIIEKHRQGALRAEWAAEVLVLLDRNPDIERIGNLLGALGI